MLPRQRHYRSTQMNIRFVFVRDGMLSIAELVSVGMHGVAVSFHEVVTGKF